MRRSRFPTSKLERTTLLVMDIQEVDRHPGLANDICKGKSKQSRNISLVKFLCHEALPSSFQNDDISAELFSWQRLPRHSKPFLESAARVARTLRQCATFESATFRSAVCFKLDSLCLELANFDQRQFHPTHESLTPSQLLRLNLPFSSSFLHHKSVDSTCGFGAFFSRVWSTPFGLNERALKNRLQKWPLTVCVGPSTG